MAMNDYLVPDYYPQFACKCGQCRHTCCRGWNISFTLPEYFKLLGMECSAPLRRKLDCAFHIGHDSDPERYATISPNWRGECPLLDESGMCVLQKECGESVMSGVRRYFPRTPKSRFGFSCACSASCEKVLEMFYDRQAPIRLIRLPLQFDLPLPKPLEKEEVVIFWQEMRGVAMRILQRRALTLPQRLQLLTELADALISAQKQQDIEEMLRILRAFDRQTPKNIWSTPRWMVFHQLLEMLDWLCEGSQSMEETWLACRDMLQLPAERAAWTEAEITRALSLYDERTRIFESRHANWALYYEHMLINHLLVDDYPFSERRENLLKEQEALCLAYSVLRFFGVMAIADGSMEALVDAHVSCFHLIEHSNFDEVVPRMAARLQIDGYQVQAFTQF